MAQVQSPPTYADLIVVDPKTKKPGFNPIWLKWFLDVAQQINGQTTGTFTQHNSLQGIQGGTTNQFYHMTQAQYSQFTGGTLQATPPIVTNANPYTVPSNAYSIIFTAATQVTLPSASSFPGRLLVIGSAGAPNVTSATANVVPLGSTTGSTGICTASGQFHTLQSDGVSLWYMLT